MKIPVVLQFAAMDHIFLFDVLSLEAKCFEEGIKNILESPDVQKVSLLLIFLKPSLTNYTINMIIFAGGKF